MSPRISLFVSLFALMGVSLEVGAADPRWPQPSGVQQTLTWDGGHVVEGTGAAPAWSWHAKIDAGYIYDVGLADEASQVRGAIGFGVGFPFDLELALSLPLGWTFGTREQPDQDADVFAEPISLGEDGPGIGDLRVGLLWSFYSASRGGLGLLLGLAGSLPTGNHERLLGEGGFAAEPYVSAAFQLLGARISINLGYRVRPEHVAFVNGDRFEQDDELFWRAGIRVPRDDDIAWSVEAEGAIGTATSDGVWPESQSRPVWLGGGLDFPLSRAYRLGMYIGFGVVGEASPLVSAGLRFIWNPVMPDEDEDGVGGVADECPLMAEDRDGFEDSDGCPDDDNDDDGFPDDEDACPLEPITDDFSDDGC
ncbi:MAG: transporter [Deltaproteobacteria bacterium]|nr:transporter [Deltaproteobacteria bacterium]